jgi:hypothetical protein
VLGSDSVSSGKCRRVRDFFHTAADAGFAGVGR